MIAEHDQHKSLNYRNNKSLNHRNNKSLNHRNIKSLNYQAVMHAGPFSVNRRRRAQNGTGAAAFGGVGDEISKIHIPI